MIIVVCVHSKETSAPKIRDNRQAGKSDRQKKSQLDRPE